MDPEVERAFAGLPKSCNDGIQIGLGRRTAHAEPDGPIEDRGGEARRQKDRGAIDIRRLEAEFRREVARRACVEIHESRRLENVSRRRPCVRVHEG